MLQVPVWSNSKYLNIIASLGGGYLWLQWRQVQTENSTSLKLAKLPEVQHIITHGKEKKVMVWRAWWCLTMLDILLPERHAWQPHKCKFRIYLISASNLWPPLIHQPRPSAVEIIGDDLGDGTKGSKRKGSWQLWLGEKGIASTWWITEARNHTLQAYQQIQ